MFLKIGMFKGLIKSAWKGSGLIVGNDGDGIYLMGSYWSIWLARWGMTNKAKAAIIELTGGLPSEGTAYRAWKDQENQYEMTELYDPEMYRPDARKFKIGYKKTGIIMNDLRKDYMVLQDTNNFRCLMVDRFITDMVDLKSREEGEEIPVGPLGRYDYIKGAAEIFWQNEVCTLKVMPCLPIEETRDAFMLEKMERYDFSERKRIGEEEHG